MKRLINRLLYFFSGTVLLLFLTYYLIKTLEFPQLEDYLQLVENHSAFSYVHYTVVGLLFLMALIFLILAFRPSSSRRKLSWQTHSGELEISKKAINSYIAKTLSRYDHIRLQNIQTTLRTRRDSQTINSIIEVLWFPTHASTEESVEEINENVKVKLEEFTNADVESIKIKIVDQATTDKRVI